MSRGSDFHGEVSSADATGIGVELKIYLAGTITEYSLGEGEYLHITDIILTVAGMAKAGLYQTADAAGKRIVSGYFGANGGVNERSGTPFTCLADIIPKVITSVAVNVECQVKGFITTA